MQTMLQSRRDKSVSFTGPFLLITVHFHIC